jgi:hypothetical protein
MLKLNTTKYQPIRQKNMATEFYKMTYSDGDNLGDHIQTIATEQFIKSHGGVDRDSLNSYSGKHIKILMQGWFGNAEKCENMFPPSQKIEPIFIGFHIPDNKPSKKFYSKKSNIEYFKKHEPIGCRDKFTTNFLSKLGVNAYFSRCLTTTLPLRGLSAEYNKTFVVDVCDEALIPSHILKKAEKITHYVDVKKTQKEKEDMANELLNKYKNEAALVITSRLHCASPCIAMGIPVIFMGNSRDVRFTAISDMLKVQHASRSIRKLPIFKQLYPYYFKMKVNWNPVSVDVSTIKDEIKSSATLRIKNKNV